MFPKGGHHQQSTISSIATETPRILYSSKPPPHGASAFVIASSCALAGSPIWAPALLGALGYHAASSTRSNEELSTYPSTLGTKAWAVITGQHLATSEHPLEAESDLRAHTHREKDHASMRRRWGIFFLAAVLAYLPVRRWRAFHQNPAWERLWYDLHFISCGT